VWAELGPEYRVDLGLSNANEGQPGGLWAEAAKKRAAGKTFAVRSTDAGYVLTAGDGDDNAGATMVLFSRDCLNHTQIDKERMEFERLKREPANQGKPDDEIWKLVDRKKYEYFVLTRVSPEDSIRVGGDVTLTANVGTDHKTFNPCVEFRFNSAGASVFGKITRRNKPSNNNHRHLAILLDELPQTPKKLYWN
jgi:SecD/SecF fusion protein